MALTLNEHLDIASTLANYKMSKGVILARTRFVSRVKPLE